MSDASDRKDAAHRRKADLVARIRERRAKLEQTFATLEQRVAVVVETKDRALRYGRLTAVVLGALTITIAAGLLLRAMVRPARRRR